MISISIHIEVTDGTEPSALETGILAALAGRQAEPEFTDAQAAEEPAVADPEPPRRTRRTRAEMEAARAAEDAAAHQADEEAAVQADVADALTESDAQVAVAEPPVKATVHEAPSSATLEEAVKLATQLVAANRVTELKDVLTKMGAKRVSELKGPQIAEFLGQFPDA